VVSFTYLGAVNKPPKTLVPSPRSAINENDRELETLADEGRLFADEWECFDFDLTLAEPD